ncbi:MAG: UbiD family decarboxylase [Chloroflexi bacterium]|nr:UbiD family decarboxylase [Chloroflexota bacterium]
MKDLREFIDGVEKLGELKVINGANWDLEIGSLTYQIARKPNPPAVIFDNIKGYPAGYRVLTIPYSTDARAALSLGMPEGTKGLELVKQVRERLNEPKKSIPPVTVKNGPVFENVITGDAVDIFKLPVPKWQPGDGGRYIGIGDTIITRDPDEGWVNLGVHRVQVHDKNTATIMFEHGKHGDMMRQKYWKKGKGCPVAVTCGSDPILVFAGSVRLPWGESEMNFAGWWRRQPIEVVEGPTTGLPIPATAEIVLEGEMLPPEVESRDEGPFAEQTGHYSPTKPESAFKVKAILHRNNPVILAHLTYLGKGVRTGWTDLKKAASAWSHLDKIVPGVKGVWVPPEWPRAMIVSVEQKYGGHAKQAALGALAQHSYNLKYIIVVDEDIDPSNINEVLFALGNRSDPAEFDFIHDSWCNALTARLTPQQRELGDITQTVVIINACKPYYWIDKFPASIETSPEVDARVRKKFAKDLA